MKKRIVTLAIIASFGASAFAQSTITGKIYDHQTKEPLPGAVVAILGTQTGIATDPDGTFTLTSAQAFDSVSVQLLGYQEMKLKAEQGKPINIALKPSSTNMQEVVVTGNREAALRSQVPIAISKLSPEMINDAKPTLITELINKVPGVAMVNYNNEQHGMGIRQPMGTSAYFLYMEDGLPIRPMGVFNHNALIEMNIFAISNVEVVKGPVSSLYGPEAVGGAINFITQKPTAVPTARVGIQADNWGYKRVQYGAGAMVTKKFGIYAGGFYSDQKNSWQSFSDFTKNSFNIRMDYNFSSRTKLYATTSYNDYYSQTGGSVDSVAFYNRVYSSTTDFTYRAAESLRSKLTFEHTWNNDNQTSVSAFYRNGAVGQNPSYAIKWKSGDSLAKGEINESSFKSYGILAQHSVKFKFLKSKLIGGGYVDYSPSKYWSYQLDLAAKLRSDKKSVETYTIIKERPDVKLADYDADLINSAGYLQYTAELVKNLKITGGLRYDKMAFDYNNYLDVSSGKKSYDQFTGKIGATYDFGKDKGVYINYSQGFSPPGLTSVFRKKPGTPANEPPQFYYNLSPAQFNNYEVGGWASLLQHKLYADVAVYKMEGRNELLSIRQPDNSTDYQSAGKTLHQGVELGLNTKPITSLSFRVGGAYSVHKYEEFILSTKTTDKVQNVNDKIMPSAPTWIANSEITFKPQKMVKGLKVALEWQRISSWYQNQINSVKYEDKTFLGLKGVSVLNFRTGYQWKGIEVFVNIMNLTDELYAHSAARGNNATDRTTFTPAAPRTYVFGLQYNFTGKK